MDFDKKKLVMMVEKKLQELIDSEDLVDMESLSSVNGKPMPEDGKGIMDIIKMLGGGKGISNEDDEALEMPEMEDEEDGVSHKNKKMIMLALSKK